MGVHTIGSHGVCLFLLLSCLLSSEQGSLVQYQHSLFQWLEAWLHEIIAVEMCQNIAVPCLRCAAVCWTYYITGCGQHQANVSLCHQPIGFRFMQEGHISAC